MPKDVLKGRSIVGKNVFDTANQTVDEIKKNHSLVRYIEDHGVKLSANGSSGQLKGLCPFHKDTNPSFSVNEVKGVFHCFGCGKSGTIIDAVSLFENVSTGEAIRMLSGATDGFGKRNSDKERIPRIKEKPSEQVQTSLPDVPPDAVHNEEPPPETHESNALLQPTLPAPGGDGASTPPLITTVETAPNDENRSTINLTNYAEYCHKRFYDFKDAVQLLIKRGIANTELYERYKIGFADGSILSKLSDKQKEELVVIGILHKRKDGTYNEHFHNCIVFPIFDQAEQVVGMYGRRASTDSTGSPQAGSATDDREPRHLYLPGPHLSMWNRKASKVYELIILVESIIDALSLIQTGVENVQPLYGVNGFTAEHLQTLKDDNVKTIVLAFDNDEAGHKAAEKHKVTLLDEGFSVKTIYPKLTKDWNEELLAGLDKETFKLLVEEAGEEKKPETEKSFEITREGIKDIFRTEHITYEIVGAKELFITNLRVNVKAIYGGESYYDNADLASGRSRRALSETLAQLFAIEYRIVERDLMRILDYYANERDRKLSELGTVSKVIEMTDEERKSGLEFLMNPNMFEETVSDLEILGYTGEEVNKLIAYLAAVSRLLPKPLSIYIQSGAGSGKSLLIDTVVKLMPPEWVKILSSVSDQSLNYMDGEEFLGTIMVLGEALHNAIVEGQIRQMQTENMISRLVAMKDPKTGRIKSETITHKVRMVFMMTSTALKLNIENASRCLVLNVDESKEQTELVHRMQRYKHTFDGFIENKHLVPKIIAKHVAAQRLLAPVHIFNPFSKHISFPHDRPVMRRGQDQFLNIIDTVCFQKQKQKRSADKLDPYANDYVSGIECDLHDYGLSRRLCIEGGLFRSACDFPSGLIGMYEEIRSLAAKLAKKEQLKPTEVSFIQSDVRGIASLSPETVKKYIRMLVEYEFLQVVGGKRHGTRFSYRLRADEPIKAIDPETIIPTVEEMENMIDGDKSI